jgi:hypothetical protein
MSKPSTNGVPQYAKNRAAVNMAVVSSAALKAVVNRRFRRRANSERGLHFSKYFIDISSKKLSYGIKAIGLQYILTGVNLSIWQKKEKGRRKREEGKGKKEELTIINEQ